MSVEQINAVRYKCHCERPSCQHEWESDSIPDRCAGCKSSAWNREMLRKRGVKYDAFGKSQILSAWGEEYNIGKNTIYARIKLGWDIEKAISTPVREKEW